MVTPRCAVRRPMVNGDMEFVAIGSWKGNDDVAKREKYDERRRRGKTCVSDGDGDGDGDGYGNGG
ncbi:hypothetical protein L249_6295 [Ophiocordyceps polyrhachis-furcata BCC 54312]|uniref:Uncharacterized protein n=1 Tax=Ophiocordyceps polyrhachis-furcata BCC 54312 TaxID=1330021 RepID=A0A367L127_9HYPO|nr:hypothetical protein L249_6295 [Ophiocordyceps polyrhachis-furcata BCC 54312]